MTTLESIIEKRLLEYNEKASQLPNLEQALRLRPDDVELQARVAEAQAAAVDQIEYMLQSMPFIKQLDEDGIGAAAVEEVSQPSSSEPVSKGSKGIDALVTERKVSNHSELFVDYMREVEGKIIDTNVVFQNMDQLYLCECGGAKELEYATSMLTCTKCGKSVYHIEVSSRNLSYPEEVNNNANQPYAYQRMNHFCEWLNSIQAKENTEVPGSVVDAIKNEFRKEGTITRGDIKPSKVRSYLKKLNLSKYYEHQNYITSLLNGVPPPKFSKELEDTLKTMFKAVQMPFKKHCPKTRKNFLSYKYTLYKFCELLGENQYLKHFSLLKSATKLHQQDVIWKAICSELGWEFIPSV
jgi:hypothetical protein